MHIPQIAPKIHFRCAVIVHFNQNYSALRFWDEKTLIDS